MTGPAEPAVVLVDVDDHVLDQLVAAALTDASADEVTAPITPDGEWSGARVEWLREFHRDRRTGLDGPRAEATWAIVRDDSVVGSARLSRTEVPDVLEIGLWLTRQTRRQGVGATAVGLVLTRASMLGADVVRATTTAGNSAALGVLRRLGFALSPGADSSAVEAHLQLDRRFQEPPG